MLIDNLLIWDYEIKYEDYVFTCLSQCIHSVIIFLSTFVSVCATVVQTVHLDKFKVDLPDTVHAAS